MFSFSHVKAFINRQLIFVISAVMVGDDIDDIAQNKNAFLTK